MFDISCSSFFKTPFKNEILTDAFVSVLCVVVCCVCVRGVCVRRQKTLENRERERERKRERGRHGTKDTKRAGRKTKRERETAHKENERERETAFGTFGVHSVLTALAFGESRTGCHGNLTCSRIPQSMALPSFSAANAADGTTSRSI